MAQHPHAHLVEGWITAWSTFDTELLLSLFTDDCLYEDVTTNVIYEGKEGIAAFANKTPPPVPDQKFELMKMFCTDDWAVMEWFVTGTFQDDLPGMKATGKRFKFKGISVLEIRDGKIYRVRDYWDAYTMIHQSM